MLTSAILAGAATQAVNAQGEFVLPTPAAGAVPMFSEAEARAHAAAWAHDFGPYNRTHLEERHGGRIDFAPLTPCPRGYFAATPYDEVPADVHPGVRNFHGPQWLVSLCSPDGTPVVSVAVAAYATNNVALESGTLTWRGPGGSEYFVQGIPAGQDFPESPERAAELAARWTGRRVTAVPELVLAGSAAPQYARWRITLDAPVAVRALKCGAVERTNVLYVGADRMLEGVDLAVPDVTAPRERLARVPVLGPDRMLRRFTSLRVPVRAGLPHGFEPVTIGDPNEPTGGAR